MRHHSLSVMLVLVLCTILALASGVFAGEKKVTKKDLPPAVLAAFEKAYPGAVIKGLSKEAEKGTIVFEIESIDGKIHRDIAYASDGTALEIEEAIAESALPEAVATAVHKEFPTGKILKAEKTTKGAVTTFELVIATGKKKVEVVFAPDGKILEKEAKSDKD
jgi:hypothetical protein